MDLGPGTRACAHAVRDVPPVAVRIRVPKVAPARLANHRDNTMAFAAHHSTRHDVAAFPVLQLLFDATYRYRTRLPRYECNTRVIVLHLLLFYAARRNMIPPGSGFARVYDLQRRECHRVKKNGS